MRCIDADALRDRLQNLADDDWNANTTTTWSEAFSECDDMVDDAPTIEPEPQIVRCKDCKYYQTRQKSGFLPQCCWFDVLTKPNDFCSNGRKENR